MKRILLNLTKWPIAKNIVVQLQGILLSNLMSAVISSWLRTMAKRAASSINRFWGDVPEISHKYLPFKIVTQGRARFCKILQNCFKTVTPGRLLFCSLLKTERGVALVHLWQGQVLGTQWRRGSQVAGLQDASDSHEVVLGSWQAVRERRILRYTASTKRKISLPKTKKYVAICYNLPGSVRAACRHSGCPRLQHSEEEMISFVNLLNFFIRNFNFLPIDGYAQVDNRVNHTL